MNVAMWLCNCDVSTLGGTYSYGKLPRDLIFGLARRFCGCDMNTLEDKCSCDMNTMDRDYICGASS